MQYNISDDALLREAQIVNRPAREARPSSTGKRARRARPASTGIIPVSASCWWRWVSTGYAPRPRKLGGATVWLGADIKRFIEQRLEGGGK